MIKKIIISFFILGFCAYFFARTVFLVGLEISNNRFNFLSCYRHSISQLENPSINLLSGIQHLFGQRVLKTSWRTVVRLNNNHLCFALKPVDTSYPQKQIINLDKWLKTRNCRFIFLMAPHHICKFDSQLPRGVYDSANQTGDKFLKILKRQNVSYLDSRELFKSNPQLHYQNFITSDTHWKNYYAFKFFLEVAKDLHGNSGFEFPDYILQEDMYELQKEPIYYGDMSLFVGTILLQKDYNITAIPKYTSHIDWTSNSKSGSGNFNYKALNNIFCCQTYNSDIKDKKILFLCDSYGIAFKAYLSLICREYRCIALNQFELQHEKLPSFQKTVEEFQPNVVLFMVTPRDFPSIYFEYISIKQD